MSKTWGFVFGGSRHGPESSCISSAYYKFFSGLHVFCRISTGLIRELNSSNSYLPNTPFMQLVSEVASRTQGSRPRLRTQKKSEAKAHPLGAKDQGHRRKCSPKKKVNKFFLGKKGLQKFFFRRSPLEENKKGLRKFSARGFWRFPTKFQRFKT